MDVKRILEGIIPFIIAGIGIAIGVALLWLFFSIAIWGLFIGALLWLGTTAIQYLFPDSDKKEEQGRVIEHDKDK